jgi:hypothetical protein
MFLRVDIGKQGKLTGRGRRATKLIAAALRMIDRPADFIKTGHFTMTDQIDKAPIGF